MFENLIDHAVNVSRTNEINGIVPIFCDAQVSKITRILIPYMGMLCYGMFMKNAGNDAMFSIFLCFSPKRNLLYFLPR